MGNVRRFRRAVGPQVRKYRAAANVTQEALTTRLQLSGLDIERTAIAKIEGGVRSVFDFELTAIAKALRVPATKLFPSDRDYRKALPSLLRGYL